jgi:hypothetical protein
MEVIVSDKEVKIKIFGETLISNFDDIVNIFKEAKDDKERKRLAIIHYDGSYFNVVSKEEPKTSRKLSTLDVLEGCVHSARKCSYDYNLEDEIDGLLGPDPYIPLY